MWLTVGIADVAAGADLDGFTPGALDEVKCLGQRTPAE
jgi:hypothetical protein